MLRSRVGGAVAVDRPHRRSKIPFCLQRESVSRSEGFNRPTLNGVGRRLGPGDLDFMHGDDSMMVLETENIFALALTVHLRRIWHRSTRIVTT